MKCQRLQKKKKKKTYCSRPQPTGPSRFPSACRLGATGCVIGYISGALYERHGDFRAEQPRIGDRPGHSEAVYLFVILNCDRLHDTASRYCLDGVTTIHLGRVASPRRVVPTTAPSCSSKCLTSVCRVSMRGSTGTLSYHAISRYTPCKRTAGGRSSGRAARARRRRSGTTNGERRKEGDACGGESHRLLARSPSAGRSGRSRGLAGRRLRDDRDRRERGRHGLAQDHLEPTIGPSTFDVVPMSMSRLA